MCAPTVMAGIGVLNTVLGMAENRAEKKIQAQQAQLQQAKNIQNAELARQQARQALFDGEKEKEKIRLEHKVLQGKKAAQYGAGNISLTGGSPLNVLADMAMNGEDEAQNAGEKARREAWNYENHAQHYLNKKAPVENPYSKAKDAVSGIGSIAGSLGSAFNRKGGKGPNFF